MLLCCIRDCINLCSLVHICQGPDRQTKFLLHSAQKCQPAVQQKQILTPASRLQNVMFKFLNSTTTNQFISHYVASKASLWKAFSPM